MLKVLLVEHSEEDAAAHVTALEGAGMAFEHRRVDSPSALDEQLDAFDPHLVVSRLTLPDLDGFSALAAVQAKRPDVPFVVIASDGDEARALEAVRHGAADYVPAGRPHRLQLVLMKAQREHEINRQRRREEEHIGRLTRMHAVVSGIGSTVARTRDRQELFQEACSIAVEHGRFSLVWVGVPVAEAKLKPIAWYGHNDGYLQKVGERLDERPEDHGIGGQALREKRIIVVNDISSDEQVMYRREALESGYRSVAALPLLVQNEVAAVLLIYATDVRAFDDHAMALLSALAGDLSFALEYMAKEERLNYLAYYDVLTGLCNRNLLHDHLRQAIAHARRANELVAVAFVDLDHFKLVNDTLGHTAGDQLLKEVARRIAGSTREGDTVARLGGDEFIIVLPDQKRPEDVSVVMHRVLSAVSQGTYLERHNVNMTCSIGVALFPQDGNDSETLLRNADAAMYRAKELGRGHIQFYAMEINEKLSERLLLQSNLRHAIEREELHVQYQPRVDLASGAVIGAEALLRWKSAEMGLVPASKFIRIAEESGLIVQIGDWVMRRVCAQIREWQDRNLPFTCISVNLSARQFQEKGLSASIAAAIEQYRLTPECLEMELTESTVMSDVEQAIAALRRLRDIGLKLSIDDFGTGYSSLSYLKRLPVNRLKIDRSFIHGITGGSEHDAAITQAVISLAHNLDLKVTAEGVETEDQVEFLKVRRCDEAQGYLFGRPMDPGDFEQLLLKRAAAA
jgi:diguanylate cyclase (GGDEF)-like protein